MEMVLLDTLRNPKGHAEIFSKYSGKEVLSSPIKYAGVICPECKKSHGVTTVMSSKRILWECATCDCKLEKPYEYYSYWWYHKAMLAARLRIFGVQVAMSGADHYNEGDFNVRLHFLRKYFKNYPEPIMIFCPVLMARDGQKMSKSRHNTEFVNIKDLITLAEETEDNSIVLTDTCVANVKNGKEYASLFESFITTET